jgi:catechol 2,3-dioxygenase-like lactoylglutathione lyase family enzyme
MHIDHAYVETRSFGRALRFWTALGFVARESWGGDGHRACLLGRDEARVVLAESERGSDPQAATVHFGVPADGALDALAAAVATAPDAVDVETPAGPTHWGTRWMRVRDPDGNLWAFEAR